MGMPFECVCVFVWGVNSVGRFVFELSVSTCCCSAPSPGFKLQTQRKALLSSQLKPDCAVPRMSVIGHQDMGGIVTLRHCPFARMPSIGWGIGWQRYSKWGKTGCLI